MSQVANDKLQPLEAAGAFSENADQVRRMSDMVRAVIGCCQAFFSSAKCVVLSFAEFTAVSNYFSSTGIFGHFYGFTNRDEKGNLVMLKGCGNVAIKIGSSIGFMAADAIDMLKLFISWNMVNWEKMETGLEKIPVLNIVAKVGLTFCKNVLSLAASTLAITDSVLIVHKKAVQIERERGEGVFSLFSKGKLSFSDLVDKKMGLGFVKNIFKIILIAMLLFAINAHWTFPIVCLVYSGANIASILIKLQQEKAKEAQCVEVQRQKTMDLPTVGPKVA